MSSPGQPDGAYAGKSGEAGKFVANSAYPYVLLLGEGLDFLPDDTFTLESDNKAYSRALKFKDAERGDGFAVLWFPLPPKEPKYSLKLSQPRDLPDGTSITFEYYLFENEVLTHRNEPEQAAQEKETLR